MPRSEAENDEGGHYDNPQDEDFDDRNSAVVGQLNVDRGQSTADEQLAFKVADNYEQITMQQRHLFIHVFLLVWIAVVLLVAGIIVFGLDVLDLPDIAQVAFISAMGIQSMVLVGILSKGVYNGQGVRPISNRNTATD